MELSPGTVKGSWPQAAPGRSCRGGSLWPGAGGGGRAWLLVQAVGAGGASPGGRLRSGALAVQWELGFGDVGGKERTT